MSNYSQMAAESLPHWLENREKLATATTFADRRRIELDLTATSCAFCVHYSCCAQDGCPIRAVDARCLDFRSVYSNVHCLLLSVRTAPLEQMEALYTSLCSAVDNMIDVIRKAGEYDG